MALRHISHVSPPGLQDQVAADCASSQASRSREERKGQTLFTCSLHWRKNSQKRLRCILLVISWARTSMHPPAVSGRDGDYYDRDWFRSIKFHPLGVEDGAHYTIKLTQPEPTECSEDQLPLGRCSIMQCLGELMSSDKQEILRTVIQTGMREPKSHAQAGCCLVPVLKWNCGPWQLLPNHELPH